MTPRPEVSWTITLYLPDGPAGAALAESWAWLAALPAHDPVRLEVEAQLHLFLARLDWREADRAAERERRAAARAAERERRRQARQ